MLRSLIPRVPRRTLPVRPSAALLSRSSIPTTALERRLLSVTAASRMASSLPSVDPPLSTAFPSDSFQLLPESQKAGAVEDALYQQQIKEVESWWASPRFAGIRRDWTAADVVSKRGSLQQSYPSSVMARKLWNLIREREAAGEPIHTMGAIDPVQMTQQAPHQEVLYLSGWACSKILLAIAQVESVG